MVPRVWMIGTATVLALSINSTTAAELTVRTKHSTVRADITGCQAASAMPGTGGKLSLASGCSSASDGINGSVIA